MLAPIKRLVLRLAKVPAEPHAPGGSPGSIRSFRAAENYWKYVLVRWGIKQAAGAFFLVLFASMTDVWVEKTIASRLVTRLTTSSPAPAPAPDGEVEKRRDRRRRRPITEKQVRYFAWGIRTIELIGAGAFLLQLPFSLAIARLDYEMRWYIVTDRSLRIREGIMKVREMTLTFANVQNITIHQGPLQRVLGLADVVVRTAGGGGSSDEHHGGEALGSSMHVGTLRSVDNAEEVRNIILERLRRLKDAGLGDPDDRAVGPATPSDTLEAAMALRDAARALAAAVR